MLNAIAVRDRVTQTELALALHTSQSTISKIMHGISQPRPKLRHRIEALAAPTEVSSHWLEKVGDAARSSPKFFKIVDAALALVNANE
ncbi:MULTISPECIES: helix-turn-helix domain-containing protein [unclassified Rhizobium]|uniref:helix-turn-helix domain-containing protein n=1 Tax=unclassified Rhizobium TaxID=2613769 RepID=UPI00167E0C1C|nr:MULTISPECIES: helix-turn-helix transcriptional regulator [unclassified Rhizobium]